MSIYEGYTRRDGKAILAGVAAALVVFAVAYVVAFSAWPLVGLTDSGAQKAAAYAAAGYVLTWQNMTTGDWGWIDATIARTALDWWAVGQLPHLLELLRSNGSLDLIYSYLERCAAVAGICGFIVAALILPLCGWRLKDGEKQVSGRRLALPPDGIDATNKNMADEVKRTGCNLHIAPRVQFPWEHEVMGLMLAGAPGSGKTEIIKYILSQLITRRVNGKKTRIIALDACKGDYTAQWPTEDFVLMAPHDDRCNPGPEMISQAMGWDVAEDCATFQDAAEFAARVIQESKEPQWSEGARLILTGGIVGLQKTRGNNWGWSELHSVFTMKDRDLNSWMLQYFPEAARYTSVEESGNATKNAASYLTNCCATVVKFTLPLSLAWGDLPKNRRISLRRWLLAKDPNTGPQAIILQRSGQFSVMSAAWIGALLRLINGVVQSAAMTEDKERRIMLVLDELPTVAAPGDPISELLATGRSKGIGLISGIQAYDQLRAEKAWGNETTDAFEAMMQTKIFGKMMTVSSGKGANAVAEAIVGKGRFRRQEKNRSTGGGKGVSTSTSTTTDSRFVVEPTFFEQLGPTLRGPRAALLAPTALAVLDWQWSGWAALRPGEVAARWISSVAPGTLASLGYTATDPLRLEPDGRPSWWDLVVG